ncbi:hypothetical protein B0T20DRAFT_472122 [Sordaria brevicollis]|uniref:Uncharacterized protein n=1 Tax=Sordaria brevicollis TaxID=83679 RepID=A0AAE0P3F3_SORBR|nr:hypothetical protein B0T20DRAFT_472122 [Sordaria brevicollis]
MSIMEIWSQVVPGISMPETIPTYEEATRPVDWLQLAGPFISIQDYARLCRVSRHFCDYFLPRLWADPFAICYALEPNPIFGGKTEPRIELFCRIVPLARLGTLSLVLAFRPRVRDWLELNHYGAVGPDTCSPSDSFPNLRCMTMVDDTHDPDSNSSIIQYKPSRFPNDLWVLAAKRCLQLEVQWPAQDHLENVVYYDDSRIHQFHSSEPRFSGMPRLRILKVAGHNMGDEYALRIIRDMKSKIWSLDLSSNRLTGRFLPKYMYGHPRCRGDRDWINGSCKCFARDVRDDLEGFLCNARFAGFFVHETCYTENPWLPHPRKYHQDSPRYVLARNFDAEGGMSVEFHFPEVRETAAFDDSLDAVVKAICSPKHVSLIKSLDICQPPLWGITHLYLNQNPKLTARSLQSVVLEFPQLQRLECDSMLFIVPNTMLRHNRFYDSHHAVPKYVSSSNFIKDPQAISGILGLSHLFRPLFVNLQTLRIHHSLVTNLPELTGFGDLSDMEKMWFAETFLLPRADLMFPNPFHPDMNPRLQSLTLTHIPRYSTGPLIERLKGLLKAAWFQEQTLARLRAEHRRLHQTRYEPPLLSGLRKIVLEFDPDPRRSEKTTQGEEDQMAGLEKFDAEALLNSGAKKEFGTFGGFTASGGNGSGSRGIDSPRNGSATMRGQSAEVRHVNANRNGSAAGSSRQQPQQPQQHGSELHRGDSETSGVRAASDSFHTYDNQIWSEEEKDEGPQIQLGTRLAPLYVPYTVRFTNHTEQKTKVFIGYRYSTDQDNDDGQSQEQPRSSSSEPADGNGASSPSRQVPASPRNSFDVLSRPEERVREESQMPFSSSSSDEGLIDRLQPLGLSAQVGEGSRSSQTQPEPDGFIPANNPPPYTETSSSVRGRSFEGSFIHTTSGSSSPTPSSSSSSDGTILYHTGAKPPPLPTSPDAIYPIPPCFFAYPYYLSLAEQQASLTCYHNLISRILFDQVGPTAPAEVFETSPVVYEPPAPVPPPPTASTTSGSPSASTSAPAPAPASTPTPTTTTSASSSSRPRFSLSPRQARQARQNHPHPSSPSNKEKEKEEEEQKEKEKEAEEQRKRHKEIQLREVIEYYFGCPPQAATPSMVRAGVPCQSFEQTRGDGGGAGCLVFARVWEAGLFGDFWVPGEGGSGEGEGGEGGVYKRRKNGLGKEITQERLGSVENGKRRGRGRSRGRNLLRKDMRRPTRQELAQMKDVVEELKKFRGLTGGTAARDTASTNTRARQQQQQHYQGNGQNGSSQQQNQRNGQSQESQQQHETKAKPKPTATKDKKGKGKGKAVNTEYGDGDDKDSHREDVDDYYDFREEGRGWGQWQQDEDGDDEDDADEAGDDDDDDDDADDRKWAGKHWMGELVVIR